MTHKSGARLARDEAQREGQPAPARVASVRMSALEVMVPTDLTVWARDIWAKIRLADPQNSPPSFRDFNSVLLLEAWATLARNLDAVGKQAPAQSQDFCGQRLVITKADGSPLDCARPKGHADECSAQYKAEEWRV